MHWRSEWSFSVSKFHHRAHLAANTTQDWIIDKVVFGEGKRRKSVLHSTHHCPAVEEEDHKNKNKNSSSDLSGKINHNPRNETKRLKCPVKRWFVWSAQLNPKSWCFLVFFEQGPFTSRTEDHSGGNWDNPPLTTDGYMFKKKKKGKLIYSSIVLCIGLNEKRKQWKPKATKTDILYNVSCKKEITCDK